MTLPVFLSVKDAAVKHAAAGISIWDRASNDHDGLPDVVMACAGDVPTLETLAAVLARVPTLHEATANAQQAIHNKLVEHRQYVSEYGHDLPEVRN